MFSTVVEEEKLHCKYKIIRDHLSLTGEQDILKEWVEGFVDRDNKIVKEFQTAFHSAFWEFYLYAVFKEAGFQIDFTKNRPDFVIDSPQKLYVEAVVANIKKGGLQENARTLKDILSMLTPTYLQENFDNELREAITRYSNAILSKNRKYNDYANDRNFDKSAPFIIALSGYEQINYGNKFYYAMLALLYGLYYDNLNDKYVQKTYIIKPNINAKIPIGIFLNEQLAHVSAILFSCTVTLGKLTSLAISKNKSPIKINSVLCIRYDTEPPHFKPQIISHENPEYLSDGLFVFHNPFTKNPLPEGLFDTTNIINVYFDVDSSQLLFKGNNLPLVARLNLPFGEQIFKHKLYQIVEVFNPDILFIFAEVSCLYKNENNLIEVTFRDLDDGLEFTIEFTEDDIKKYEIEEELIFCITFKLHKFSDLVIKNIEELKLYLSLNRERCLFLNQCTIIDIKKVDKTQNNQQK